MDREVAGHLRRRLMVEALVAAGPRKSGEEYRGGAKELCEDCAGYMSVGDFIVFWICDGTSNDHELPKRPSFLGFNSRMLAQDLGEGFARIMIEALAKETDPLIDLQNTLFSDIALDWQNRLKGYLSDVDSEGKLEQLLAAMPEMADGSYLLEWSSTLLGGVYNEQKRTLDIINIGDSGAVVVGKYAAPVTPKKTRMYLRTTLSRGDSLQVSVYPLKADMDWKHFEEVEYFIAMSDGVARDLNSLLDELIELKNTPVAETRRRILMRGELSYDDQAVVVGRLMPE